MNVIEMDSVLIQSILIDKPVLRRLGILAFTYCITLTKKQV